MSEYYLIGAYKEIPVYFSTKQGLMLGSRMDELVEPTAIQNLEILREFGGIKGIETVINKYDRDKARQLKKVVEKNE